MARGINTWMKELPDPDLVPQYRGEWAAVPYKQADLVSYNGGLYVAQQPTVATDVPMLSSTKWKFLFDGTSASAEVQDTVEKVEKLKASFEVESIAAMKLLPVGTERQIVRVLNYYAQHKGGGGIFIWEPTSTKPHDYGFVFQSDLSLTGRWHRQATKGVHHIRDFGALDMLQDPTHDNYWNIQWAHDALDGPVGSSLIYSDADKSGGTVVIDPGMFGIAQTPVIYKSHTQVVGYGQKNSVICPLPSVPINGLTKLITFRWTSHCGLSDVKLDGKAVAKIGLDCDLTDCFTSQNLMIANTRIAGIVGCNLWESYFSNTIFYLTGFASTVSEPGAAILLGTERYRQSNRADAPDGLCNNTVFAKPTFSVYGAFYRCESGMTANITLENVIAEIPAWTSDNAPDAIHEDKFYIKGWNTTINNGYIGIHQTNSARNGYVFNVDADSRQTQITQTNTFSMPDSGNQHAGFVGLLKQASPNGVIFKDNTFYEEGTVISPHVFNTTAASKTTGSLNILSPFARTAANLFSDNFTTQASYNFEVDVVSVHPDGGTNRYAFGKNRTYVRTFTGAGDLDLQPYDSVLVIDTPSQVILDLQNFLTAGRNFTVIKKGAGTVYVATNGVPIDGDLATRVMNGPYMSWKFASMDGAFYTIAKAGPSKVPTSATSEGYIGDWAVDTNYRYECVARDTWKKTALVPV